MSSGAARWVCTFFLFVGMCRQLRVAQEHSEKRELSSSSSCSLLPPAAGPDDELASDELHAVTVAGGLPLTPVLHAPCPRILAEGPELAALAVSKLDASLRELEVRGAGERLAARRLRS